MNSRYGSERDLHDLHEPGEQDREISLGTTTILGIFFALALLCAVFFGFGYSMGRRSAQTVAGAPDTTTTSADSESNSAKPSSGSLTSSTSAIARPVTEDTQSATLPLDSTNPVQNPQARQDTQPMPIAVKAVVATRRPDPSEASAAELAPRPAALVPVAAALPASPGTTVVQVAAMSHQEDADVVAVDLKRRGYTVAIRHEPQDKLFHVQIGPFASKKESDAMRQRLQGDGYNNAIVKP